MSHRFQEGESDRQFFFRKGTKDNIGLQWRFIDIDRVNDLISKLPPPLSLHKNHLFWQTGASLNNIEVTNLLHLWVALIVISGVQLITLCLQLELCRSTQLELKLSSGLDLGWIWSPLNSTELSVDLSFLLNWSELGPEPTLS